MSLVLRRYFILDNILALNTGFMRRHTLVTDRQAVRRRYFAWSTFLTGTVALC
jgi:hypothetical protein